MGAKRALVLFVIACLLRAFLPCSASRVDVAAEVDGAMQAQFRCEGHGCCCESIERCELSCCCFPEEREEPATSRPVAPRMSASRARLVIEAPACGGEMPDPAVVFLGIVAIVPAPVRLMGATPARARRPIEMAKHHATRRPSPEAPPPRLLSHVI